MSILVDPHICPDCRAPLDSAATCTGCGLRLVGPPAAELWERMQQADRLVEQLRVASQVPAMATQPLTAPASDAGVRGRPTAPPTPPRPTPPRGSLPSASVPVVLLTLGGLCLLVAAIVFVAVAWSSLGLAAKTLILLTVTALFAAAAVAVTRRELRFASETLWLVVAGLVAVDLSAAYGSDLLGLGRLGDRGAVGLVGGVLLGLAVGVGAWATGTVLGRLHGLVGVAAVGTALLAGAEAWTSDDNPLAVALSVPLLALLAWAIDRVSEGHLRPTALVVAGAAGVSWLVLVGQGVDRMSTAGTDSSWWTDLTGWPLLAAAGLAAALAVPPRLPAWSRSVAAGACLVTLGLFAVGPSTAPTADLLAWAAVTAVVALVSAVAPLVWARPAALLSALGLVVWSVLALVRPLHALRGLPTTAHPDRADLGLHLPAVGTGPAAWTAIVVAVAVGAAAGALLRHLPTAGLRDVAGRTWIALGPGVVTFGLASWFIETEPTLLAAVLVWSAAIAVAGSMAMTARHQAEALAASLVFAAYLVGVGLRLAVPSHLLAALLASAVAVALAAAYTRARRELLYGLLRPLLAATAMLALAFAATHWPYLTGGRENAAGVTLALTAAAGLVLARLVTREESSRLTLEATAVVAGLFATVFPLDDTVVAIVLTIVGSAIALVAVLNDDRELASWLALPVLGLATALRVAENVTFPELSTLPAAAALLAAGWWRLGRDPRLGSTRALASGLTLALVPSLLLVLDEPVTVRGALVAAAGLAVLAIGVARRWAAPFVAGAVTTALLALRHLGPVVDAVPRWISLGSVGVLLLLIGITWEQRRRDVETAGRYLASLG